VGLNLLGEQETGQPPAKVPLPCALRLVDVGRGRWSREARRPVRERRFVVREQQPLLLWGIYHTVCWLSIIDCPVFCKVV